MVTWSRYALVCPIRFALVCVGSDTSSRKLLDLLAKRELHGQNPIVTPCNKQSLSQFEMQSRKSR
jgi:cleavage and polyadenylation specificity factor subunit 6/7